MSANAPLEGEKLLRFLYQCPVGIAELDVEGRILMLNAVGTQLLMPLSPDGRLSDFFAMLGPEGPALRHRACAPALELGEVCRERRLELTRPRAPDSPPLHLSLTLIRLDASTLMATLSDVSVLVAQERQIRDTLEAQAFTQGKMQMASTVLHDTGNAVTGIGARVAQLLADTQWPERVQVQRLQGLVIQRRDDLDRALGPGKGEAISSLLLAIDDALARRGERWQESMTFLSRSVAHIQEILSIHHAYATSTRPERRQPVSIPAIIDDALAIHRAALAQRSIEVTRTLANDLPLVPGDRTQLVRVLLNLVKNAADAFDVDGAGPSRKTTRTLELRAQVAGDGVVIVVVDNACGFEPDQARALLEAGATTRAHGSGIGLDGSRRIVEAHGGQLWLESDGPGRGARAHVSLPVAPRSPP